jgi:N-methylhydantoinase A/oxoprolinase/acetone carboxylase beta subunit
LFEDVSTKELVRMSTPVYEEVNIPQKLEMVGPALVIMNGSTIVVEPGWKCLKNENDNFELFFCVEDTND